MINGLTIEQREWVRNSGFENLLEFKLEILPAKLAYQVLKAFDHTTMSLQVSNEKISITEEDVFDIFGLPYGGETVKFASTDSERNRIIEWKDQFPEKDQDSITTSMLVERVKGAQVDDIFKLNFLLIMSNVLIGTPTHSYMDKQLVKFDDDLDQCVHYNWAEFLLKYLASAKDSWNHTASLFSRGSLIFLTVSFYTRLCFTDNQTFMFLLQITKKFLL